MSSHKRVCAYVNLENAIYNMNNMHANIDTNSKIMAVIKTDAYGHGAVELAKKLNTLEYLQGFAVATLEEALELRKAGIKKTILILGFVFIEDYEAVVANDIRIAVFKKDMAIALSNEAKCQNKTAFCHIKIDTGMGRIGFLPNEESAKEVKEIAELNNLKLEGIFTHFAKADMTGKEPTLEQIDKFKGFIKLCDELGVKFDIHHCSNSAGIIDYPEANFDMVRAGITLYGLWPSDEVSKDKVLLKPLMSVKSHIAYIKTVKKGTAISYGGTYVSDDDIKIATIPVGYGDGYPRSLSNKGYVLIHGKMAKILGRVCMDQMMVDVSDIDNVSEYDEVTLIGRDGDLEITMEQLGDMSGRFNYELACDIGKRVPRVYI